MDLKLKECTCLCADKKTFSEWLRTQGLTNKKTNRERKYIDSIMDKESDISLCKYCYLDNISKINIEIPSNWEEPNECFVETETKTTAKTIDNLSDTKTKTFSKAFENLSDTEKSVYATYQLLLIDIKKGIAKLEKKIKFNRELVYNVEKMREVPNKLEKTLLELEDDKQKLEVAKRLVSEIEPNMNNFTNMNNSLLKKHQRAYNNGNFVTLNQLFFIYGEDKKIASKTRKTAWPFFWAGLLSPVLVPIIWGTYLTIREITFGYTSDFESLVFNIFACMSFWTFTLPVSWPLLTGVGWIIAAIIEEFHRGNGAAEFGLPNIPASAPNTIAKTGTVGVASAAIGGAAMTKNFSGGWVEKN